MGVDDVPIASVNQPKVFNRLPLCRPVDEPLEYQED
jgi:hypothetical protein